MCVRVRVCAFERGCNIMLVRDGDECACGEQYTGVDACGVREGKYA